MDNSLHPRSRCSEQGIYFPRAPEHFTGESCSGSTRATPLVTGSSVSRFKGAAVKPRGKLDASGS